MRVLSSFRNGSGSLALVGKELTSGRAGTAQSAPSSSTLDATAACAGVVLVITETAPATASVAIANTRTAERILERPKLTITRALLPGGVMETALAIDDHGCRLPQPRVRS